MLIFVLQIEQIHIFPHSSTPVEAHTNAPWAGSCSRRGGSDFLEAEPDAAELCFGNISGHQTLNHSLSPLSVSPLYDSLIIYFISLCLTLSHSHPCISVSISSRERMKYAIREGKHIYQICHLRKCVLCLISLLVNKPDSVYVACRFISSIMQKGTFARAVPWTLW